MTCNPPASGVAPNSYNFYSSLVSGGPYGLLGNAVVCGYTDTTQAFGTTIFYVAASVNTSTCPQGQTCVSAYSNQVTAVIPANPVPNPPTNLTLGAIQARAVPLKWSPPIPQSGVAVDTYAVYRGGGPLMPSPSKIATVAAISYTDSGCQRTCYYYVRANDTVGKKAVETGPSNIVRAQIK
jgi:hypothetical protein